MMGTSSGLEPTTRNPLSPCFCPPQAGRGPRVAGAPAAARAGQRVGLPRQHHRAHGQLEARPGPGQVPAQPAGAQGAGALGRLGGLIVVAGELCKDEVFLLWRRKLAGSTLPTCLAADACPHLLRRVAPFADRRMPCFQAADPSLPPQPSDLFCRVAPPGAGPGPPRRPGANRAQRGAPGALRMLHYSACCGSTSKARVASCIAQCTAACCAVADACSSASILVHPVATTDAPNPSSCAAHRPWG